MTLADHKRRGTGGTFTDWSMLAHLLVVVTQEGREETAQRILYLGPTVLLGSESTENACPFSQGNNLSDMLK